LNGESRRGSPKSIFHEPMTSASPISPRVMRAAGEEIELAPMSFNFPPATPRGGRTYLQLSIRGAEFRQEQPMPHSGVGVLRIRRSKIPEDEAPLYA
jgi:hypothetical protein